MENERTIRKDDESESETEQQRGKSKKEKFGIGGSTREKQLWPV
jgi:hypothetical protein